MEEALDIGNIDFDLEDLENGDSDHSVSHRGRSCTCMWRMGFYFEIWQLKI